MKAPPITLSASPTIVRMGSAIQRAIIRGATSRFNGSVPNATSASIWSLDLIAPSSAVIPADIREATTIQ